VFFGASPTGGISRCLSGDALADSFGASLVSTATRFSGSCIGATSTATGNSVDEITYAGASSIVRADSIRCASWAIFNTVSGSSYGSSALRLADASGIDSLAVSRIVSNSVGLVKSPASKGTSSVTFGGMEGDFPLLRQQQYHPAIRRTSSNNNKGHVTNDRKELPMRALCFDSCSFRLKVVSACSTE